MASKNSKKEAVKSLPPIKILFTESFNLLKKVIAPFIIFNILIIIASTVAITLMIIGIILLGIGGIGFYHMIDLNPLAWGLGALGALIVFFIIAAIICSFAQIGSTIILFEANPKISIFSVIKRSAKYIIPLIILGLITSFFMIGGFFLLIIPAIVFSLLFSFAYFIVITEDKTPLNAIRRSIFLVKNNFSAFFVRMIVIWALTFGVGIILSAVTSDYESSILTIISFIIHVFISWFSAAYMITLFKELQKVTPSGQSSLKVFTIISIVGWILAIFISYSLFTAISGFFANYNTESGFEDLEQQLTPSEREELERIFKEIDGELNLENIEENTNSEMETSTTPADTI